MTKNLLILAVLSACAVRSQTLQTVLQLHADASEVSGVTNGSVVTPSTTPSGFTGTVVVNSGGSVHFAPAHTGDGVYFLNCCAATSNAYYRFAGSTIGSVFNVAQGQITFYLVSRATFAQRITYGAGAYRESFDACDGSGTHIFSFTTVITGGPLLEFIYVVAGSSISYFVPIGTEDALFGAGVTMKVSIAWSASGITLSLNDTLVKTTAYAAPSPNWNSSSVFLIGANAFSGNGYDVDDDILDEFTVMVPGGSASVPVRRRVIGF